LSQEARQTAQRTPWNHLGHPLELSWSPLGTMAWQLSAEIAKTFVFTRGNSVFRRGQQTRKPLFPRVKTMFFEEATPEPRPRRAAPAPEPCPRRGRSRAAPVPVPRPRPSRARAAPEPRPCPSRSEPSRSRDIGFRAPEKWFDVCILNMILKQFCVDPGPGVLDAQLQTRNPKPSLRRRVHIECELGYL
jgi:hypothetical protein